MLSMSPAQSSLQYSSPETSPSSLRTPCKRSLETDENADEENGSPKKSARAQPTKRACNECRQQKLKCNVQQQPFVPCGRCVKHGLSCVIEANFKRVEKRNRHAEIVRQYGELQQRNTDLERKIAELSYQLRENKAVQMEGHQNVSIKTELIGPFNTTGGSTPGPVVSNAVSSAAGIDDHFLGAPDQHQAIAASLLDLRGGSPNTTKVVSLENVALVPDRVEELFREYFDHYHEYLPFLDSAEPPDDYLNKDRLLFWTIIAVAARHYKSDPSLLKNLAHPLTRLIWSTISQLPQNHHVVKALCLLCTWPLPTDKSTKDQTHILCGFMMTLATQIGLHHPSHPQDFSRTRLQLRREDINDRLRTWAVCNIVAQTVSTGFGQPPVTLYNGTLDFSNDSNERDRVIPPALFVRLRIEMAADRISRSLYTDEHGANNVPNMHSDAVARGFYYANMELRRLMNEMSSFRDSFTGTNELYYKAVILHLRLHAFFDVSSRSPALRTDLLDLYYAAKDFLESAHISEIATQRLIYTPSYIYQMMLAAGFALLKLLNSEFAHALDRDEGRRYFSQTVYEIRSMKVQDNDLPHRLAEVLAQLWKASGSGLQAPPPNSPAGVRHPVFNRRGSQETTEDPLRLKVRSRMSMSVVFDSIWRWRENAGETLEATAVVNNPTNPDTSGSSSPPTLDSLDPISTGINNIPMLAPDIGIDTEAANPIDFFDPMGWLLNKQSDGFAENFFSYEYSI